MKLFIFTCLLAVALAKHKTEQQSSSEEFVSISQEKFKDKNLATISSEETICASLCKDATKNTPKMASSSSSSSEEFADIPTENKKDKLYQKLIVPSYNPDLYQYPIVMSPWNQIHTRPYPIVVPTLDKEQISTIEDILKKTTAVESSSSSSTEESTEIFTKKTKMDEVQKIIQSHLSKIREYFQKVFWPQAPESVDQYLKVVIPWNYYNPNADQVDVSLEPLA